MSVDSEKAFAFMRMNYKYGLLDKTAAMMGEALEGAMDDLGLDFEDVLMRMDGAGEDTIEKINHAVEKWSGLALRLAVNEPMTRLQAKLFDFPPVRRKLVSVIRGRLARALAAEPRRTEPVPASLYRTGRGGDE